MNVSGDMVRRVKAITGRQEAETLGGLTFIKTFGRGEGIPIRRQSERYHQ